MLEIQDLVKIYPGPVAALTGISLEIGRGMFGLLGPNGAGKSTLMKIIAGLLEPTSGTVRQDGEDVTRHPERIRRRLGYLPQSFGFYPHLSGERMLAHLLELKGVRGPRGVRRLARELLDQVGLADAATRKVKGYSGGMRQRLGIAQAIAGDPALIIVDEPTAGLDPEERLRFYRILAELAQDRVVLLSTHIVEDVAVLCSRFALIKRGRIVAETSPSEATARLRRTIFEARVEPREIDLSSFGHRVTQSILVEGKNRVRIHLREGAPPPGFLPVEPLMEDAYFLLLQDDGAGDAGARPPRGVLESAS